MFSVDHCFPVRGQGTVLTGTILSGALAVNEVPFYWVFSRGILKGRNISV